MTPLKENISNCSSFLDEMFLTLCSQKKCSLCNISTWSSFEFSSLLVLPYFHLVFFKQFYMLSKQSNNKKPFKFHFSLRVILGTSVVMLIIFLYTLIFRAVQVSDKHELLCHLNYNMYLILNVLRELLQHTFFMVLPLILVDSSVLSRTLFIAKSSQQTLLPVGVLFSFFSFICPFFSYFIIKLSAYSISVYHKVSLKDDSLNYHWLSFNQHLFKETVENFFCLRRL